jgi:hypothetical protein
MTDKNQTEHFANEIDGIIDRARSEYDLSYAAIVGVLQMKIHLLCDEASERADEV